MTANRLAACLYAAAALSGGASSGAASAQANCWNPEQAAAARVRDLQSKLMVATMQCHAIGAEIAPAYNAFIRINKSGLEGVNGTIKARFAQLFGAAGQAHYDRFTTSLANAYGADQVDASVCEAMRRAASEAETIGGDPTRLLSLAERMGVAPRLPDGLCPVADVTVHVAAVQPIPAPVAVVRLARVDAPAVSVEVATPHDEPLAIAVVAVPRDGSVDGPRVETPIAPAYAEADASPVRSRPALTLAGLLGDARD